MLAISRNVGQSVTIGGNITVKVYGVEGKKVKLAILAPREIPICRDDAIDDSEQIEVRGAPVFARFVSDENGGHLEYNGNIWRMSGPIVEGEA